MDITKCLVTIKGAERTRDILTLSPDNHAGVYSVRFANSPEREYTYRASDVRVYKPKLLNPKFYAVSDKNGKYNGLTAIYRYEEAGYWCLERNGDIYVKADGDLRVSHSALEDKAASNVLEYLKEISFLNSIRNDEGERLLSKRYEKIGFVAEDSTLACYLSRKKAQTQNQSPSLIIYPFGTNRSQKKAVANALANKISVIQGPPGTGKTQTILTIVANLILQNKTVEIVSNNNSAVDNVKEKLERYGFSFLVASLGSADNKTDFIANQTGVYPDVSSWTLGPDEMRESCARVKEIGDSLDKYYQIQETRQKKISELSSLDIESRYFAETFARTPEIKQEGLSADAIMDRLQNLSFYFQRHERLSLPRRVAYVFLQRTISWPESGSPGSDIIQRLQWRYYCQRRKELQTEIESLGNRIKQFDMIAKEKQLSELSLRIFKGAIYDRLEGKSSRPIFTEDDLWRNSDAVVKEYPVITSTAFSSSATLSGVMYDYVILDEASQCDIAAGALALHSSKNAVVVGDSKQLQNIVTEEDRTYAEAVFKKYSIPEAYRYSNHSFLASITSVFPGAPTVMLCEHYRCNPNIIEFCNKKFYDDNLVVMTCVAGKGDAVSLFLAPAGYHSREHANLRQAEVLAKEVLPLLADETGSIGIITPYRNNVKLIKALINREDIKVDTIHSFQGRECDTVIFVTSDDIATEFSDDPMLINVAVSRAKKRFILVSSDNPQPPASNTYDLVSYISYNSFRAIRSGIVSIFDMLYEQSKAQRLAFLANHRKISEYDSENLMYAAIEEIITSERFLRYDFRIACHYPLRYLFKATDDLTADEKLYLSRSWTHVDFLLYRSVGKVPVVAIEVDGFKYHKKGSRQKERDDLKDSIFAKYEFPLLRFATNGSGEVDAITAFLASYVGV